MYRVFYTRTLLHKSKFKIFWYIFFLNKKEIIVHIPIKKYWNKMKRKKAILNFVSCFYLEIWGIL